MSNLAYVGTVVAVCRNPEPGLPKPAVASVRLIEDWGVEGDYHAGKQVRHRYLVAKDPTRRNDRQVLLVDAAVYAELAGQGIQIGPGMMGENITVQGIDLLSLATGTRLSIGAAVLEVTEIRNPCLQLNGINPGLLKAVVKKEQGQITKKAGIMTRVLTGGDVRAGDQITVLQEAPGAASP